jgi:hypothetical protein
MERSEAHALLLPASVCYLHFFQTSPRFFFSLHATTHIITTIIITIMEPETKSINESDVMSGDTSTSAIANTAVDSHQGIGHGTAACFFGCELYSDESEEETESAVDRQMPFGKAIDGDGESGHVIPEGMSSVEEATIEAFDKLEDTPSTVTEKEPTDAERSKLPMREGPEARALLEQLMGDQQLPPKPSEELGAPQVNPEGAILHQLAVDNPHPDTAEIVRQVEYYFSDENLSTDSHLLSFTGVRGMGWVSLNRIFGFKKMRSFKPPAKAKKALMDNTSLEIDETRKYIRRRLPLEVALRAAPEESKESRNAKILIEKPWLSKAMLKPTGFEEGFTEGPLLPEEHEAERKLYDPEEAFTIRVDYAVAKYMSKRKMHQQTLHFFSKFLIFGGFDGSPRQFTGGFDQKDMENYDKDEILQMKVSISYCIIHFTY